MSTASPVQPSHPQLAVSAAIFRDGKILLVRRARSPARGFYSLPGGRVEFGEPLHTALHREVDEETALKIEIIGLAGWREVVPGTSGGGHYLILSFAARWIAENEAGRPNFERLRQADHDHLIERVGVGTDTAGALLVAAGENSSRIRNERSFARLCGAAPLDASSGKQQRHRLSRSGDRQANSALWRIVITRLSYDPATRRYLQRRCAEGKTKAEAIRCLKRYVARELYACLPQETLLDGT